MNKFTEFHKELKTPERFLFQVRVPSEVPWYYRSPHCMFCGGQHPNNYMVLDYKHRESGSLIVEPWMLCDDCAFVIRKIIDLYWEHSGE